MVVMVASVLQLAGLPRITLDIILRFGIIARLNPLGMKGLGSTKLNAIGLEVLEGGGDTVAPPRFSC